MYVAFTAYERTSGRPDLVMRRLVKLFRDGEWIVVLEDEPRVYESVAAA